MRRIELKEVAITNTHAPEFKLNYRNEFLQACEISPEGLTIAEMGVVVKIADKLRSIENGSVLALEEAEYEWLTAQMKRRRFSIICEELITMVSELAGAQYTAS